MSTEEATPGEVRSSDQLGADLGLACIAVVTPAVLAELLQLPAGCQVDACASPHDQPGVLHLRVRGAGWPTRAGMLLPHARATIKDYRADDGELLRRVVDWHMPQRLNDAGA